jgi:hypothetical protein
MYVVCNALASNKLRSLLKVELARRTIGIEFEVSLGDMPWALFGRTPSPDASKASKPLCSLRVPSSVLRRHESMEPYGGHTKASSEASSGGLGECPPGN